MKYEKFENYPKDYLNSTIDRPTKIEKEDNELITPVKLEKNQLFFNFLGKSYKNELSLYTNRPKINKRGVEI